MKKILLLVVTALMVTWHSANAQQDAQFTQYMFNTLFYNPAYAGLDEGTRFQVLSRAQWLGYNTTSNGYGGINTYMVSANAPIQAINSGIGFHAVLDYIGPRRLEEYQLSLAHHIDLGKGKLSFALRPGVNGVSIDRDRLVARDQNDQVLSQLNNARSYRFDLGAGVMYKTKDYYVGVSASRILAPDYNFGINVPGLSFENKSVPHVYLTGGYNFFLNDTWTLTPSTLVRYITNTPSDASVMVDANLMVDYDKFIFGGLSYRYRSSDASLVVGVNLLKDKNLRIIYAADLVTPGQTVEATARTSHEISLSYALPFVPRLPRPAIKTPRFRY